MNITVGSAPDSWGVWFPSDPQQTPWHRFMDEIVEAGYEWTELGPYGYLPTDLSTLRRELSNRGLKVTGTFAMANVEEPSLWGELERQVLGAGERLAALDAKYLVLIDDTYTDLFTGEAIAPKRLDEGAWGRFIETTHKVADIARDRFGLQLVFHPHAETHVEYEDQIEAFLSRLIRTAYPSVSIRVIMRIAAGIPSILCADTMIASPTSTSRALIQRYKNG